MNQAPPPVTPANAGTTQTVAPATPVAPANKPKSAGGLFSWLGFGGASRRKQVKKNKNAKSKSKNKKNKKTRRKSRR
jgi:hypothetical protein